ncbi:MAG: GGDEF domain-containing protein [Spirochaetes bacterium]|nr:GGDEF domain-containing protein [Spirochaetota bacterium]MBN2769550.1 GGDEF domain-containing protein [Spirochaetota bacterium]
MIDDEAFAASLIPDKTPLFVINSQASQHSDVYLRVQTSGTMRFPIKIWSFNSYIKYKNRYNLFAGVYYGILTVLFFITFVIFFYHRLHSYVCFAMFVLSAGIFFSLQDGTFFEITCPEIIRWKYNIYIFAGTMSIVILTKFVYELFVPKTVTLYLRLMYYIVFCMGILATIAPFFFETSVGLLLLSILSMASFVPNFVAGVIGIRAGKKSAIYFLAGLLFLMTSITVFTLRGFGVLPVNVVTLYAKDAGVLVMILITSIGIVDVFSNYRIQSITDSLTGLVNRRYFFDLAQKEIDRSIRYGSKMSLILIDVDYFKKINDKYGHSAGDRVLYELALNLKSGLRSIDNIARLGGEEFVCVLPDTNLSRGLIVAERLRKKVEAMEVVYDKYLIKCTISAGVAVSDPDQCSIGSLLETSDMALYRAKRAGRNMVFGKETAD